ncbi:hypothetical protein [Streptomyces cinereoruber]|uniref:hypothetical protein n=1 Tax=Streptomyces cinereoruber TaxID=67260 RepID=UPI003629AB90
METYRKRVWENKKGFIMEVQEIPLLSGWVKSTLSDQEEPEAGTDLHRLLNHLFTTDFKGDDLVITWKELEILVPWMVPLLVSQERKDENSDICVLAGQLMRVHGGFESWETQRAACICTGA